ncbi:helix-turn-helix domain-containing protein [Arthrobacter sp. H14]|uniref:helix-turn-helix domain-containing protein n=1 Tax=Arthrobacter sp. H14 TaxID=1312959 RepID=UPI0004B65E05|nr:helix-turn-helix domain-containing protein [Arthrobacter sp. H14]
MQEDFAERVVSISEYSRSAVSDDDLRSTAAASIELILRALASDDERSPLLEFATDLGDKRAHQGLPAEALVSAVRLNFPIIWTTLLSVSSPADAALLIHKAEEVWRVVDDYAAATHSSYLAARVNMAQEEAGVRQEFISALFSSQGRLPETRERFAKAFGVDASSPFGIAVVQERASATLRQLAARPNQSSRLFLHQMEDVTYAFWPTPYAIHSYDAPPLPPGLETIPCGVATSFEGLVGLAAAGRIAAALSELHSKGDGGPLAVTAGWTRLAHARLQSIGVDLAGNLDQQLSAHCRNDEIERLRETVLCYSATGNVNETAAQLYCHRNTILNRLRRFKQVTGIDVVVPGQAARAVVAWG